MLSLAIVLVFGLNKYFASSEVVIACEGTTLNISCPTNSIVDILDANYGRTSATECPKQGLDSNIHCTENVTKIVSQRCESLSFCSINATNDVFKDPCEGTYKYLEVNYTCTIHLGPGPVIIFPDCGENEERGCVNPCNKKCQECKIKRACPLYCLNGCVCKPGYIKDTLSGMCVGDKYCPLPGSPCDTHEQYSECDAACQPTCTDRKPKKCTICMPGYICDKRYLRDSATGQCVLPSQCSKKSKS